MIHPFMRNRKYALSLSVLPSPHKPRAWYLSFPPFSLLTSWSGLSCGPPGPPSSLPTFLSTCSRVGTSKAGSWALGAEPSASQLCGVFRKIPSKLSLNQSLSAMERNPTNSLAVIDCISYLHKPRRLLFQSVGPVKIQVVCFRLSVTVHWSNKTLTTNSTTVIKYRDKATTVKIMVGSWTEKKQYIIWMA